MGLQQISIAFAVALPWALGMASAADGTKTISSGELEFFETKIRPVLVEKCSMCHSGELAQANLRLDFRAGWETGGKSGPAIVPGDPPASLLIQAIRHEGSSTPMPLGAKLAPAVVKDFEEWVLMGAPDPRDAPSSRPAIEPSWEETFAERQRWWSLQPVVRPPVPDVQHGQWSDRAVDRFILAELEAKGLSPAAPADRATLLRRLSIVLRGLPPSPEEVAAFLADPSPEAYERAVDRFLDSPHFGERWARHWMDVVRYSDTYGYEFDMPAKGSWRYRDYLIRAFNDDIPFDQLLREQIAGDLLPEPRINTSQQINESLIGPMFFQLGEKRHGDSLAFNGIYQEMLNAKVDAFSKAFQATTVACARCHDHKLDAISQRDFYALAGVLMSSRWVINTLDTPDRNREILDQLAALKPKLRDALAALWLEDATTIPAYLRAAQACSDGEANAAELAEGLDARRLDAWGRVLYFQPDKEAPMEDPAFPWFELNRTSADGPDLARAWRKLAADYASEEQERSASNARDFSVLADFRESIPEGWALDGVGLRRGRVANGDFAVALESSAAVSMLLPAGLFTHALSPRLNGAVRSPFINHLGRAYVSFEASGGDLSIHRLVPDNAFLTERQGYLEEDWPSWTRLSTVAHEKTNRPLSPDEKADMHITLELLTKASNPYFPPRVGLGKCTEEQVLTDNCGADKPQSWFGITRVALHDGEESPADELARFRSLFRGDPPVDRSDLASRYGKWLTGSLAAWADGSADADDVRLINWMLANRLLNNDRNSTEQIRELVASYRAVEKQLLEPATINGMADLEAGRDRHLNIRGVYEDLGVVVPRGYLEVLSKWGDEPSHSEGSGRLELARLIASPENPLTTRVFVNRVWHWVFGSGLVRTTDDFGHLGDRPSHPALLDYLASRFVEHDWSVKELVRMLVASETFQQSGRTTARAREVDPLNRLLHHYPLRRLDAETIRDSLLAVSGRLDRRLFGRPINPHRSNEDATKRLLSGPLDGNGRRSIYLKMTIMEPPKFLATFNQPAPKIPTGRRDVTNVPAQALTLLNDPFVGGQAELWARELIATPHESPQGRLTEMFERAFSRKPEGQELARWVQAIKDITGFYQDVPERRPPPGGMMESLPVWKDIAHAMFNTKEFFYVR